MKDEWENLGALPVVVLSMVLFVVTYGLLCLLRGC